MKKSPIRGLFVFLEYIIYTSLRQFTHHFQLKRPFWYYRQIVFNQLLDRVYAGFFGLFFYYYRETICLLVHLVFLKIE